MRRPAPDSLLDVLSRIPDPRRRAGRRYPFHALLGLVILGMLHGHGSLHGAWFWAKVRWPTIWRELGAHSAHFPAYNTVHNLLARLDADAVSRQLRVWLDPAEPASPQGVSADGKVLRGSKRADVPALQVLSLVIHEGGHLLAQRQVVGGNEVAALLAILTEVPLTQRTITMDAGLTHPAITEQIITHGGDYLGVVKGNHAETIAVLDDWVAPDVFSPSGGSSGSAADPA